MDSSYAPNPGSAESQRHNAQPAEKMDGRPAPAADGHDHPDVGSGSPYRQHYEPTAEIWKLYLRETEAEDMELAQLWQIGLDQLLIFAGLFGAILTAFLIESRQDLKEDPLHQILRALQNNSAASNPEPFRPMKSSLVVNVVWFTSLGLTLISALAAVLARGWLAQYTPATPGVRSSDACERHLRYLRSREWRLAVIVGGIPLLIQLALVLFAAGLVVFTAGDNAGISLALLVMTGLTGFLYFLGTILPWFSPACPFQTTLSDFIPGVAQNRRYVDPISAGKQSSSVEKPLPLLKRIALQWEEFSNFLKTVHRKPGRLEIEADILAWMLTNSTNEKAIEEAVKAIAGAKPSQALRDALHDSGASAVLCQRFSRFVKIMPESPTKEDNELRTEAYLYAMLRIVEPCGKIGAGPRLLLDLGQALHRWDSFVDYLRPLACALRIRLLLAAGIDDHAEQWDQTRENLSKMAGMGLVPDIRHALIHATLDGLSQGGIQLRKACAIILCKQFQISAARKMIAMFNRAAKSEFTVVVNIIGVLKYSDAEVSEVILAGIATLAKFSEFRDSIPAAMPQVVDSLKDNNGTDIRVMAANNIARLSEQSEFCQSIQTSIPQIVKFLNDKDSYVRWVGVDVLAKLSAQVELREVILACIPRIIEFLKDDNHVVRAVAAQALGKLSSQVKFQDSLLLSIPHIVNFLADTNTDLCVAAANALANLSEQVDFRESIRISISHIVNFLADDNWAVRRAGIDALGKLSERAEFRDCIQACIPQIIDFLKDNNGGDVRSAGARTLAKLSDQVEFRESIHAPIPQIVEFLEDNNSSSVRVAGADTLGKLSEHSSFRGLVRACIPRIANFHKDNNSDVRAACSNTMAKLSEQGNISEFRELIQVSFPDIIESLRDNSWVVRKAGVDAWAKFSQQPEFRESIQKSITPVANVLKDNDIDVRQAAANALAKLSDQVEFRDFLHVCIPQFVTILKDSNTEVCTAGVHALVQLSEEAESRDAIQGSIPHIVGFLKAGDGDLRQAGANALSKLSAQFQDSIRPALVAAITSIDGPIPLGAPPNPSRSFPGQLSLDDLLEAVGADINGHTMTRFRIYQAVKCLFTISDFAQLCDHRLCNPLFEGKMVPESAALVKQLGRLSLFRPAVQSSIPHILDSLTDTSWAVSEAGAEALSKLSKHDNFRESIRISFPQIVKLVGDTDRDVRRAGAHTVAELSKQAEFHASITASIPQIHKYLTDNDHDVRRAGANALTKLAERAEFQEFIQLSIPHIVDFLTNTDSDLRVAGADALAKLSEQADFRERIRACIPHIANLIKDDNVGVREAGGSALVKLSEQAELRASIKAFIPQIIDLLNDNDAEIRGVGANTLAQLSGQAEFRKSIGTSLPLIMRLVTDEDRYLRWVGLEALGKFSEQAEFHKSIRAYLPNIIDFVKEGNGPGDARGVAANALTKISEEAEFRESIQAAIPHIQAFLRDTDYNIRGAGASALAKFSDQAEFRGLIGACISQIADLLGDNNWYVRRTSANALAKLSAQAEFRESVRKYIPHLVRTLNDNDSDVRTAGVNALAKLAQQGNLCASLCLPELRLYIPTLLMDPDVSVVSASAELLGQLLVHEYFRDMIPETINLTMKALYSVELRHRRRAISILAVLQQYDALVPILHEVWAIYSFAQHFLPEISVEQTTTMVNNMALYGILKTV